MQIVLSFKKFSGLHPQNVNKIFDKLLSCHAIRGGRKNQNLGSPMKNPGYGPMLLSDIRYMLRATPPNAAAAVNFSLAAADNGKSRRRASLMTAAQFLSHQPGAPRRSSML
jgi:hypothetical protein